MTNMDEVAGGDEELLLAVPVGLVDALRAHLDDVLGEAAVGGIDTGALALELARTAVSWDGRYRPGVVL